MIIAIILLSGLCIGSCIYAYTLYKRDRQIIEINVERQRENDVLEQEVKKKKDELENIQFSVNSQNNILQSLTKTTESMRESAESQANDMFRARLADLRDDYQQVYENLDAELQKRSQYNKTQIQQEEEKLAALLAKQHSYNEAILRQEAIAANRDYYRLALDIVDLNDIALLRDLQKKFSKKEIIDKLIWDYYKPAYDILMAHISDNKGKICGIYRITDMTTNQSYIGQSVDIRERFRQHIKAGLAYGKATNKLYQAMQISGPENFIFEILEEVSRPQLNERETYWIEFYETKTQGLNATRGGS